MFSLSVTQLCLTLCDPNSLWLFIAHQAPLSMEFSRQEYWNGLSPPTPRDLSDPGIKLPSLVSPVLTSGFFITVPPGKPIFPLLLLLSHVSLCDPISGSPPGSHLWDSPGKNTGVGCHFLLQCMKVKSESEVAQSCPTLCDTMDCSLPGSAVHGISQARVLEWVSNAFSKDKN